MPWLRRYDSKLWRKSNSKDFRCFCNVFLFCSPLKWLCFSNDSRLDHWWHLRSRLSSLCVPWFDLVMTRAATTISHHHHRWRRRLPRWDEAQVATSTTYTVDYRENLCVWVCDVEPIMIHRTERFHAFWSSINHFKLIIPLYFTNTTTKGKERRKKKKEWNEWIGCGLEGFRTPGWPHEMPPPSPRRGQHAMKISSIRQSSTT